MNKKTGFPENSDSSAVLSPCPDGSLRDANAKWDGLLRDRRFQRALAASVVLHAALFAWVNQAPSQPQFDIYGNGAAVSLVGVDEIPGGSARGKSGDRPEDLEAPVPQKGSDEGARKLAAPEKKPAPAEVKRIVKKNSPGEVRRISKTSPKKVAPKKGKPDRYREARLREVREGREQYRLWRERYDKTHQNKTPRKYNRPRDESKSDKQSARVDLPPRSQAPPRG